MKKSLLILSTLLTFSISDCATSPMTPDEFRQNAPNSMFGNHEKVVVKRSFKKVARAFKKMAPKCLNKKITVTGRDGMHVTRSSNSKTATVVIRKNKAELHLQEFIQGTIKVYKEPKGGYYTLVVDATPAGKNRTTLNIYGSVGKGTIIKAIKGWASGKIKGCPDMTW